MSVEVALPGSRSALAGIPRGGVYRRQLGHDIRHELTTIMLLATVLDGSKDLGADSRARVAQILAETRWLEDLVCEYEQDGDDARPMTGRPPELRIDQLAADILRPIRMSAPATITLDACAVSVRVDRLAFWRALRNLICNALAAVGDGGRLAVRVYSTDDTAIVDVDDDGPGFDPDRATPTSLGLKIIADLVSQWGGKLTIGRGSLGGCGVRLCLGLAGT